jgi:hypothetical protein
MRKQFISADDAPTMQDAETLAPWAAVVVECDGGWLAFESSADAETWGAQA